MVVKGQERGRRNSKLKQSRSAPSFLLQSRIFLLFWIHIHLYASVQGPYRTGKSFLLNQLVRATGAVPSKQSVFTVGNTVDPETEDVSVYIIPECASPVRGSALLFLDSPGLNAPNRVPLFDAQVLQSCD